MDRQRSTTDWGRRKSGHNPIKQVERSFQTPGATASTGASVQHGLSAAGGVLGFNQHCSAADRLLEHQQMQQLNQAFAVGMQKAIVARTPKPPGQHVLEHQRQMAGHTQEAQDSGLKALLDPGGKSGLDKYLAYTGPHKAFAVCADGAWTWVTKQESPVKAAEAALSRVRKHSADAPCSTYAVDDQFVRGTASVHAKAEAARALLQSADLKKSYWDEDKETNLSPVTTFNRTFHGPTPTTIPGAKAILTTELKRMLSSPNPPLLVNVLAKPKVSIPGSLLSNDIGSDFSSKGDSDALEFLGRNLKEKNAPVVFYCLSWECWLSYNAALRAVSLGYTGVVWYRGGIYSWFDAGLPFVAEQ